MHNYTRKAYLNIPRMVIDAVLCAGSYPLAVLATDAIHADFEWMGLLWMPILYMLVVLFSMNSHGLYEATTFTYQDRTLRGVTASCLSGSALCTVFLLFMPQTRGNTDILAFYSLIGVLLMGIRYFITLAAGQRTESRTASQVLLIGAPEQMQAYLYYLDKTSFQVNPVGFLSHHETDRVRDLKRLGAPQNLPGILDRRVVDEVVFAWPRQDMKQVNELLQVCAERGILAKVALDVWQAPATRCHVHSVGPVPVLIYHRSNLSSLQQSVKRAMDIVFGLLGLVVMAAATVVIFPLACHTCRGKVFVRIPRTGLNGRPFRQLRYRVTRTGCQPASRQSADMTPMGRFLFRSRLQYLPSFWNVLRGHMSLVGTRGSLQPANEGKATHTVMQKPGLTGLWHIRDFDRVLDDAGLQALDEEYAERWNLVLDLRILLLTPVISLVHRIIGQQAQEEETT